MIGTNQPQHSSKFDMMSVVQEEEEEEESEMLEETMTERSTSKFSLLFFICFLLLYLALFGRTCFPPLSRARSRSSPIWG